MTLRSHSARLLLIGQGAWFIGIVLISVVGSIFFGHFMPSLYAVVHQIGIRLVALAILIYAISFIIPSRQSSHEVPIATKVAWITCWSFAILLAVLLFFNVQPEALVALHLLFLGWAGTLVYGMGYLLFPALLGRPKVSRGASLTQLWMAVGGVSLMAIAFGAMEQLWWIPRPFVVLATGGTLATIAALLYVGFWLRKPQVTRLG